MTARTLALGIVALAAAACAAGTAGPTPAASVSAASASVTPSSAATPTATPSGTTTATRTGGAQWTVTDASTATVRVREQLAGFSLPSDAVLTAKGAKGVFGPLPDGTFTSDSKISFDLSTLSSDSGQRDGFVKRSTLNVSQFPTADFVPLTVTGVALPLAEGDFSGTLSGRMTIRGISKDVTFTVKGTRGGSRLTATATADPALTFGQFGMTPPTIAGRVLSIVDAIHLTVEIVATGG